MHQDSLEKIQMNDGRENEEGRSLPSFLPSYYHFPVPCVDDSAGDQEATKDGESRDRRVWMVSFDSLLFIVCFKIYPLYFPIYEESNFF